MNEVPSSLGIGHLAAAVFVQSWDREGEGAVEHLRRYAQSRTAPVHFGQCAHDARCLLDSGLTSAELDRLWCWCTGGNHLPSRDGLSGREWLETVYSIMSRAGRPVAAGERMESPGSETTRLVEDIVGEFRPRAEHDYSLCPVTAESVRDTLRRLVRAHHPDLALRIFLVLAAGLYMAIPASLFRDIVDASRALGHPEHFLEGIDFLVSG